MKWLPTFFGKQNIVIISLLLTFIHNHCQPDRHSGTYMMICTTLFKLMSHKMSSCVVYTKSWCKLSLWLHLVIVSESSQTACARLWFTDWVRAHISHLIMRNRFILWQIQNLFICNLHISVCRLDASLFYQAPANVSIYLWTISTLFVHFVGVVSFFVFFFFFFHSLFEQVR